MVLVSGFVSGTPVRVHMTEFLPPSDIVLAVTV